MATVSASFSDACPMVFYILLRGSRTLSAYCNSSFSSVAYPSFICACLLESVVATATATVTATELFSGFVTLTVNHFYKFLDSLAASSYFLHSLSSASVMLFRSTTSLGKTLLNRGIRGYTSSTTPKAKAYAPAADYGYVHHPQGKSSKSAKGDYVPVYVALGMIALSTGLGLHTAWHQLRNSPTVRVKKQRRETLPEVVEPEHVAEESDKFLKHSFFRKVAHVQDHNNPNKQNIPDPIRKDAFAYRPRVETLKSVGVDPSHV